MFLINPNNNQIMRKALLPLTIALLIIASCGLSKNKRNIETPQPIPEAEIEKPLPPNDAMIVANVLDVNTEKQDKHYVFTVTVEDILQTGHGFKFNLMPKSKIDILSTEPVNLKTGQTVKLQITGTEKLGGQVIYTLVKIY